MIGINGSDSSEQEELSRAEKRCLFCCCCSKERHPQHPIIFSSYLSTSAETPVKVNLLIVQGAVVVAEVSAVFVRMRR